MSGEEEEEEEEETFLPCSSIVNSLSRPQQQVHARQCI